MVSVDTIQMVKDMMSYVLVVKTLEKYLTKSFMTDLYKIQFY